MDGDVVVAVGSALFVPEAERVQQLVHYCALALTSVTDRHVRLTTDVAHWSVATENGP